jgi:hypothetical protein
MPRRERPGENAVDCLSFMDGETGQMAEAGSSGAAGVRLPQASAAGSGDVFAVNGYIPPSPGNRIPMVSFDRGRRAKPIQA